MKMSNGFFLLQHGWLFYTLCASVAKCGPGDTYCGGGYLRSDLPGV